MEKLKRQPASSLEREKSQDDVWSSRKLRTFSNYYEISFKKKGNSTFCACVLWSFLKTLALENLDLIPELRHISYLKIVCLREVCCDL